MQRNEDTELIEILLGELRYVLTTGDIRDSERNSIELRDKAAQRIGFADYAAYDAECRKGIGE